MEIFNRACNWLLTSVDALWLRYFLYANFMWLAFETLYLSNWVRQGDSTAIFSLCNYVVNLLCTTFVLYAHMKGEQRAD